jgi:S1-C subfamily serine protease
MRRNGFLQRIFFFIAGMLVIVALLIGFGLIRLPKIFGEKETAGRISPEAPTPVSGTKEAPAPSPYPVSREITNYTPSESRNIRVYEQRNRGVVNITTETLSLNWFLEPVPQEGGAGSGSIIDEGGYILTNKHVVQNAYKVFITLYDGSQFEGKVIGIDGENDLAVVKFDPGDKKLTSIPFGSSSTLKVGQEVLAIGNPFGYDRTLTTGIVSGLGRPVKASRNRVIRGMIQTDASINPGNSGGPLLDVRGDMIGINTMIYSPSGGSVGIGFAIPVDTARRVVPELIEYGHVRRGWIELFPIQLEPSIVRYGKLPVAKGIMVSEVKRNGNADKAGIQGGDRDNPVRYGRSIIYFGGDIIVEVDGMAVVTISDLFSALEDNRPGETVEVVFIRKRKKKRVEVELVKRPEELLWE